MKSNSKKRSVIFEVKNLRMAICITDIPNVIQELVLAALASQPFDPQK
jgi:hypothetical protein